MSEVSGEKVDLIDKAEVSVGRRSMQGNFKEKAKADVSGAQQARARGQGRDVRSRPIKSVSIRGKSGKNKSQLADGSKVLPS